MIMDYWEKRALADKKRSLQRTKAYELEINKQMKLAVDDIQADIKAWVSKYAKAGEISLDDAQKLLTQEELKGWKQSLADWERMAKADGYKTQMDLEYYRSRISRLNALEAQMKATMAKYATNQTTTMQDVLSAEYTENYNRAEYNIQGQIGGFTADFARITAQQVNALVNADWAGSNYSKRIWGNFTEQLPTEVTEIVRKGILLGYSADHIVGTASLGFKQFTKARQHRLIITEMSHATNEATFKRYEENNIQKYRYMATLERHTCHICQTLDGEVFDVDEKKVGMNYPPIHPHCRCTTVAVIDGLNASGTRWYRNPETGKGNTGQFESFAEWKNKYLANNDFTPAVNKPIFVNFKPSMTKDELKNSEDWKSIKSRLAETYSAALVKRIESGFVNASPELISSLGKTSKWISRYTKSSPKTSSFVASYSNDTAILNMSTSVDKKNVYAHEMGHATDFRMGTFGKYWSDDNLHDDIINEEIKNHLLGNLEDKTERLNHFKEIVKKELQPSIDNLDTRDAKQNKYVQIMSGISDVVGGSGLLGNDIIDRYPLNYGHSPKYWAAGNNKIAKEFVAHVFQIYAEAPEAVGFYRKYLPKSMAKVEELIKQSGG